MVYRLYVEKREELANEAKRLFSDCREILGVRGLEKVRILNRYDAENMTPELFSEASRVVFSEPQLDITYENLPETNGVVFAVEYLPGQFDQRSDSAAQCIQIISRGERPLIRSARVYILEGRVTDEELAGIKKYVINPVEAREASLELPETLELPVDIPTTVPTLDGFTKLSRTELEAFVGKYALAMDADDIAFCQNYFIEEKRDPTLTEIRMIDTYWSDHCRHTTFLTAVDSVKFEDDLIEEAYREYLTIRDELKIRKPVCLMDIATIACKYLKKTGALDKLDESEEINACTVKTEVEINGKKEPWLLLFKNETHNHPTEIEPFGGAATCIGGAIRDPLSGRAYVYGAMRVTGASDPTVPVRETIPGKLPQRKIVTEAAAGYSSYGNQIGLATGIVDEIYHPGYQAKRMEIGAVIAAAPEANVRRECPTPGDAVILIGGRTGRDGIGGATGSSKAHDAHSVETCGAEVQKGNAPEERKLQRLFRNPEASSLIKRCNDFGAGGVSVAIGELADGLMIDLNAVSRKYEGLDGTELAISESQERMAVVVSDADAEKFMALAAAENLEAAVVARVTEDARLKMVWNGQQIVDISRDFLNSNGAEKHTDITASVGQSFERPAVRDFKSGMKELLSDLNVSSKRGLSERFDSTIGRGTVLMPFGGKFQKTPIQCMVQKISSEKGFTDSCSFMSWGYNPLISEKSPYRGAYLAVVESVSKLIAAGAAFKDVYLTFQEYFEKPKKDPKRWGKPFEALLGALKAQLDLRIAAIGGKDSMSGSFEDIDVPPTLVSFAVTTGKTDEVVSNEFKKAGHKLILIAPITDENGLPDPDSLKKCFAKVTELMREGKVYACQTTGFGGIAEAVYKMCIGNGFGFRFQPHMALNSIFSYGYGSFLLEVDPETAGQTVGEITEDAKLVFGHETLDFAELNRIYEGRLETVYPVMENGDSANKAPVFTCASETSQKSGIRIAKPRVLIPVFPGTNCEYDSVKALEKAGFLAETFVIRNLTAGDIANSTEDFAKKLSQSQLVFIPGGFSGGDEPDGSGKFIMAFFRNGRIREGVNELLKNRDGLMCGICNGFQALIKLGLVPFGEITDTDVLSPTLTYNTIGRHQSKMVRIRVASNKSPWLSKTKPGDVYTVPISHGEGRFLASEEMIRQLAENGQIATQYADLDGEPSMDIRYNPNLSAAAIEGITSADGRVFGKMGHTERYEMGLYKNVEGCYNMNMFEAAADYFA